MPIKAMLKAQLFRTTIKLLGLLPLGVLQRLGNLIGTLLWLSRSRMWLVTLENIQRCYPKLDAHRQSVLARQSLKETGKTIAETAYAWSRDPEVILAHIEQVSGTEHVAKASAAGRGIIFVIPHLGNWEIINHYLGKHHGLTHMYQPSKHAGINHFIQQRRGITGTQFVTTSMSGIKQQLRVLRQGGCIGLMPDQEPLIHTGTFAPFFNIEALSSELIEGYSRTGARVIVATCERSPAPGQFKINFWPVDTDQGIKIHQINEAIEAAVRITPEQYLWSYKRFRTRPQGELDFYQFNLHPLRSMLQKAILKAMLYATSLLPLKLSRGLAVLVASITPLTHRKKRKHARINLHLCNQAPTLLGSSTTELVKTAFELGRVWSLSDKQFFSLLPAVEAETLAYLSRPTLVLTPPLGNREVVMRYLGHHYHCSDYYHPNSNTAIDDLIRFKRAAMGVRLFEHGSQGRAAIIQCLRVQQIVTLCPDQQPRLRGGIFVPFFGFPALTTTAIPQALKQSGANLVIGLAERTPLGFSLRFVPVDYDQVWNDEKLLDHVNQALEKEINRIPAQYRWSDKRFNIQPPGRDKVYR